MEIYKKISIVLFIVVLLLLGRLVIVSKKLEDMKVNNTSNQSIENTNEYNNNTSSDKDNSNQDIDIKDITSNIEGLNENDNKTVREVAIKFLKSYANYVDKDDNFEKRMKSRVYDIKELMTDKLYEEIKTAVEVESLNLGHEYVFRKLNKANIYESNMINDKVYIKIGTFSSYYDSNMQLSSIHENSDEITTDYKFTIIKDDNGKWIIEDVQETFK